jgi:HSP20 family protein
MGATMANLIRRDEPGIQRGWDPFEILREMTAWDPLRAVLSSREVPFIPQFEVKETKDGYLFRADLPGVKEEDVDVSIAGNRLTITGKRDEEKRDDTDRMFLYERSYGSFTRSFTLPEGVDSEHVDAELKDGVLALHLSKRAEIQPKRISLKGAVAKVKGAFEKEKGGAKA